MSVTEIIVALPNPALPNSDWADAYKTVVKTPYASAREAAEAIIAGFPFWTYPMLALRQIIVLPLGLKGAGVDHDNSDMLSIFPIKADMPAQLIAGFDDKHLDFRLIVDVADSGAGQSVTLTTVIKRHNWAGRLYLSAVIPFHRAIIRSALRRL